MSFISRMRSLWRGVRRPDALADDMQSEMRFHVELETERLIRERGLGVGEARRQARVAFGSVDRYQEEGRDARGISGISGVSLDVKLGARMLRKYPGVSIVGLLALTIGIGLGAAYLEIVNDYLHPSLPLPDGDRIVGLQNWDAAASDPDLRSLHDFVTWRDELRSITDVSAFRAVERNLGDARRAAEPAYGAEISASGFAVARVAALYGRTLIRADEEPGAAPVIVLGHDLWRTRFGADTHIVGRTVRLGGEQATVVGVMQPNFGFPISHQFWVPLRVNALAHARGEGPSVFVFGRLAEAVSHEQAQAELAAIGRRTAAMYPDTHEHLRPRVLRYTQLFVGGEGSGQAFLVELLFVLLLLVLSSNVATMMFARTATRENEIAMRFALGASRRRILVQFFLEALVLASAAAIVGIALVAWSTQHVTRLLWDVTGGHVPFWLDGRVNPGTIAYALLLAVIGSVVAGVLPALKATGAHLQTRLRQPGDTMASGLRFGGLWSAAIVVQVMLGVLVIPPAIVAISGLREPSQTDPGFAAGEYLSARIELEADLTADTTGAAAIADFAAAKDEIERRLAARPEVSRITFAARLPGMDHPQGYVEVEPRGDKPDTDEIVMMSSVEPGYFDAFGARIVAGRDFTSADLAPDARVVIVNRHFVNDVLHGRSPIGRRMRYSTHWFEIVGVVDNLGMDTGRDAFFPGYGPGVYHPLGTDALLGGGTLSVRVAFHVRGNPASFAPQLREIAQAVHPELRLYDILTLDGPVDRINRAQRQVAQFSTSVTALIGVIALLISIAGTYSVMSFTVARQTREIGIRMALGADRRRVITGVFSRALIEIAIGILAGALAWGYVIVYQLGGDDDMGLLLATASVLLLVGLLACGVPVRRALSIEPAEALRDAV